MVIAFAKMLITKPTGYTPVHTGCEGDSCVVPGWCSTLQAGTAYHCKEMELTLQAAPHWPCHKQVLNHLVSVICYVLTLMLHTYNLTFPYLTISIPSYLLFTSCQIWKLYWSILIPHYWSYTQLGKNVYIHTYIHITYKLSLMHKYLPTQLSLHTCTRTCNSWYATYTYMNPYSNMQPYT